MMDSINLENMKLGELAMMYAAIEHSNGTAAFEIFNQMTALAGVDATHQAVTAARAFVVETLKF